jgi:hypothetical protein
MRQLVTLLILIVASTPAFADPPDPPGTTGPNTGTPAPPPVEADDPPEKEEIKPPPMPVQMKKPTQKLKQYDRIVYVLDVSCSMMGKELDEAISVTDVFASDGFLAAVYTFDTKFVKWGGAIEDCEHRKVEPHGNKCLPEGWARMPTHRDQLRSHLSNIQKGGGQTIPGPALSAAITTAPNGALIVFVSDGQFNHEETTKAVKEAIQWREKKKLAPVQVLVWSTDEELQETLVEIASIGGGGLWRAYREPVKEEEEDEDMVLPPDPY